METKVKFFLLLEKEENWLNEQLNNGLELVQVIGGFIYRFQPLKTENQVVRMDYRTFRKNKQYSEYKMFMKDAGWHHTGGKKIQEGSILSAAKRQEQNCFLMINPK